MLRVSLIMTTYNSKDNFIKSYESIRQQTWPDIEVVVVDGASTDGTKEEIEKLSTEEIQYAINEVYARHGLKFTKKSNQEKFEKKKWYTGTVDDQDDITLNRYEKKNVNLMADILEERGAR